MFKKILFAIDASPACEIASKIVFELSEKYGSELILLHVDTKASKKGSQFFKKFGNRECRVVEGEPAEEILKLAQKSQVDCIVLGVHAQKVDSDGQEIKTTAGKTIQKVLLKAHCPVLSIARPCETCFWYFNQIIFGTNFSKASQSAFQFAYKLADYIGCKLHIFHALDIDSSEPSAIPGQKQIEDQIKEAKTKIKELYVSQMENFDNYDIAVWEGTPYIELLKFARETKGDLIVMAHHTKGSDPEKTFPGRTFERVILRSACPVISVDHN